MKCERFVDSPVLGEHWWAFLDKRGQPCELMCEARGWSWLSYLSGMRVHRLLWMRRSAEYVHSGQMLDRRWSAWEYQHCAVHALHRRLLELREFSSLHLHLHQYYCTSILRNGDLVLGKVTETQPEKWHGKQTRVIWDHILAGIVRFLAKFL